MKLISCLPEFIPNDIEIDISDLNIGDTLRVKNISEIEKIEILSNPESTLISILAPRILAEQTTEETSESTEENKDTDENNTSEDEKK